MADSLAIIKEALEADRDPYEADGNEWLVLPRDAVAALVERLEQQEGLWHCTLEDKAAADAHWLAVEERLKQAEAALRHISAGTWNTQAARELSGATGDVTQMKFARRVLAAIPREEPGSDPANQDAPPHLPECRPDEGWCADGCERFPFIERAARVPREESSE